MEITLKNNFPHTAQPANVSRYELRQFLRAQRRALTAAQQQRAALHLADRMALQQAFRRAQHIAVYIANDGELDASLLAQRGWAQGKECYLPVLGKRTPSMAFARYRPGDKLLRNRYGIPEPMPRSPRICATELDLVCLPLVGFDRYGNRLGMGGGFYDRTFAYRHRFPRARPRLVGLAHRCQQLTELPVQSWDVPLDMIATDAGIFKPND